MIFRPYYHFETGCAGYVFGCGTVGKCAVVDLREEDVESGHARENASQLYDSIRRKLFCLPDDIEIYPGHFSGSSCGAGMSGKPSSTIGYEKRWNVMLGADRDSFVDKVSSVSVKPAEMERNLEFNSGRLSDQKV